MFWRDITNEHNGKKASVSARSTPISPERGQGPYVGTVVCAAPNAVPVLRSGDEVHAFAWYWEVEFID
jgi:hypothetical protein